MGFFTGDDTKGLVIRVLGAVFGAGVIVGVMLGYAIWN